MNDEKVIYLDMDGVICNFHKGVLLAHRRFDLLEKAEEGTFPTDWWYNGKLGSEEDFWKPIDNIEDFWAHLLPYPWMEELLFILEDSGIKWYLCTQPRNDSDSYSGKMKWIHHHLGGFFEDIIMMKDKYLLARENTLLIDDNADNVYNFREHGGQAYLFPQPWNNCTDSLDNDLFDVRQYVKFFETGLLCYDRT